MGEEGKGGREEMVWERGEGREGKEGSFGMDGQKDEDVIK